jgi:hypothetical protein
MKEQEAEQSHARKKQEKDGPDNEGQTTRSAGTKSFKRRALQWSKERKARKEEALVNLEGQDCCQCMNM